MGKFANIICSVVVATQFATEKPALAEKVSSVTDTIKECVSTNLVGHENVDPTEYSKALKKATKGYPAAYDIFYKKSISSNIPIRPKCITDFIDFTELMFLWCNFSDEKEDLMQEIFLELSQVRVNDLISILESRQGKQDFLYKILGNTPEYKEFLEKQIKAIVPSNEKMDVNDVTKLAGEVYDVLTSYLEALKTTDESKEFKESGRHSSDFLRFLQKTEQRITSEIKTFCRVGGNSEYCKTVVGRYKEEMISFTAATNL